MRVFCLAFLALNFIAAAAQQPAAPAAEKWSYYGKTGTANWGKLDPAFSECSHGKAESPVDIRGTKLDKELTPIEFHYQSAPLTLTNNGHTIQANVAPGSYIVAEGTRYDLQQFHFHHPSEHLVHGKVSDLEIHLVHKSADGKLAVVSVRVNEGQVNGALAALWTNLPTVVNSTKQVDESFNPSGLLPTDQAFWYYPGSLTTPPCTEGVQWFVMETPTELSGEQLRAFAAIYPDNARPAQGTHGRKIEASR